MTIPGRPFRKFLIRRRFPVVDPCSPFYCCSLGDCFDDLAVSWPVTAFRNGGRSTEQTVGGSVEQMGRPVDPLELDTFADVPGVDLEQPAVPLQEAYLDRRFSRRRRKA